MHPVNLHAHLASVASSPVSRRGLPHEHGGAGRSPVRPLRPRLCDASFTTTPLATAALPLTRTHPTDARHSPRTTPTDRSAPATDPAPLTSHERDRIRAARRSTQSASALDAFESSPVDASASPSRESRTGRASDRCAAATARVPTRKQARLRGPTAADDGADPRAGAEPPTLLERGASARDVRVVTSRCRRQRRLERSKPGELATAVLQPRASRARQDRPSARPAPDSGADPSTRAAARAEPPTLLVRGASARDVREANRRLPIRRRNQLGSSPVDSNVCSSQNARINRASDCRCIRNRARPDRDRTDLADIPQPTAAPTQAHEQLHVQSDKPSLARRSAREGGPQPTAAPSARP